MSAAMSALDAARAWIACGQSVIPVGFRSKRPDFAALKWVGSVDLEGRPTWDQYSRRAATEEELLTWFGPGAPALNLGVVTGYNGLVVLDFDSPDAWSLWQSWAGSRRREDSATTLATKGYRVTSARGVHLYVRVREEVTSYAAGAIDVKARWGYVLAPPSVHPSGAEYRSENELIMSVDHLSDVFPLGPTEYAAGMPATRINDPWEQASRATEAIAEGSVARIHGALRVEDLLGIQASRREVMVRCPLHNDTNPSMLVNLEQQYCVCFAGCNGGHRMDAIDLYAALHGLSNREAIAELAETVGR